MTPLIIKRSFYKHKRTVYKVACRTDYSNLLQDTDSFHSKEQNSEITSFFHTQEPILEKARKTDIKREKRRKTCVFRCAFFCMHYVVEAADTHSVSSHEAYRDRRYHGCTGTDSDYRHKRNFTFIEYFSGSTNMCVISCGFEIDKLLPAQRCSFTSCVDGTSAALFVLIPIISCATKLPSYVTF